jgi:hypothetical protein
MAARSTSGHRSWPKRVGWLVLIWMASVTGLGVVAMLFRLMMNAAGLAS